MCREVYSTHNMIEEVQKAVKIELDFNVIKWKLCEVEVVYSTHNKSRGGS